jgi:hypothetical protein
MAGKKIAKGEKPENQEVDLKEILGDIKDVVSGEKEALFKVSEYKTINLKKENLITSGRLNRPLEAMGVSEEKLRTLIRTIVNDEINKIQRKQETKKVSNRHSNASKSTRKSSELKGKVRSISELKKMTKKELEDYGRMFAFEVDRRVTKDKIINQVSKLK